MNMVSIGSDRGNVSGPATKLSPESGGLLQTDSEMLRLAGRRIARRFNADQVFFVRFLGETGEPAIAGQWQSNGPPQITVKYLLEVIDGDVCAELGSGNAVKLPLPDKHSSSGISPFHLVPYSANGSPRFAIGILHPQNSPLSPDQIEILRGTAARLFDRCNRSAATEAVQTLDHLKNNLIQAETRLRESEERFARFMKQLPGLAWIKDSDGRYVFANEAAELAFGTDRNGLFGKTDFDIFPAHIAESLVENDRTAIEIGNVQTEENFEGLDGRIRVSIVNKFHLPFDVSAPMVGAIAIDITEHKRSQEFREFLFSISEIIRVSRRPDDLLANISVSLGKFLDINRCLFNEIDEERDVETVHRDYYRSGVSLAGRHKVSAYSPIASSSMRSGQTVVNRDSKTDPRTAELFDQVYGPDSELAYIAVPMLRSGRWVASIWCSDDRPRDWAAQEIELVENIAERAWAAVERLRTEEILARNQQMFSMLVEAAPFGVYFIDADFRLISVNKGAQAFFAGIDPLIGRDFTEVLRLVWPEPMASEAIDRFRHTLASGEPFLAPTVTEVPFQRDSAESYDWQIHRITLPDGSNGVVCYFYDLTVQKSAETALKAKEAELETILNNTPFMLGRIGSDLKYKYVSAAYAQMLGETQEAISGRAVADIMGKQEYDSIGPYIDRVLQGETVRFETSISVRESGVRDLILDFIPEIAVTGEIVGWITSIVDVTERKMAERRLRESEELFSKAFKASPLVLTITSLESGKLIEVNDTFTQATGYSRAEAKGKTTLELGLWARPPDREAEMGTLRAKGELTNAEYRFKTRSGKEIIGLLSAEKVEIGGTQCALTVIQDITERKRADDALRESERRFRHVSNSAPILIWMTDTMNNAVWFNKGWLDFTGRSLDQESGEGWRHGIQPDDLDRCLHAYGSAFEAREEFIVEYRLRREDGTYRWILSNGVPRFSPDGDFLGYIGSCVDINDRRSAEAALRESRERLQLAQQAGNVGVWDWDIIADKTFWSETMWAFYGEPAGPENPDHHFWASHLLSDDRARVEMNLEAAIASGDDSYKDEFRIVAADGQVKWIASAATIVRGPDGNATRVYGVNIDISERKTAEERIRRSELQLRLVTDAMPALIAYVDDQLRYRFVNEKYAEWFGLPLDQILHKTMRDVIGDRAFAVIQPHLKTGLSGKPVHFQTSIRYKAAGRKFVAVSYIPDVAEDGTVRGIYSLVNDLTEWKRSQDLLLSSEQRVAMMMETVSDYAIFALDPRGIIETWNAGAENIFRYPATEAIGQPIESLFSADDMRNGVARSEMRTARREGRASDERWLMRKDGSAFFANSVMMPLIVGKAVKGFVKIVSDLTEKKRRSELLQKSHDQLELMVRDRTRALADVNETLRKEIVEREHSEAVKISLLHRIVSAQETERQRIARDIHDQLGQRLTALRLKLASLRDHVGEQNAEIGERVERLQEIAHHLDSEVSFLASELRPNTLDDLGLEEALRAHADDWSRHYDIKLDFHFNGLGKRQLGRDAEIQLYRIAQEALNNVAKHAQATEVGVLIEKTGDSLVLIVEDDGVGFDTASGPDSPKGGGLGLMGMNERASLIGATIEVESVAGGGTAVFVRLPLDDQEEKR